MVEKYLKSIVLFFLFLFLFSFSFTSLVLAQENEFDFRLNVVDARDYPVEGAIVKIDCSNGFRPNELFYTDAMGDLYLLNVSEGDCLLRVAYDDYFYKTNINLSDSTSVYTVKFNNLNKSSLWWLWIIVLILFGLFLVLFYSKINFLARKIFSKLFKKKNVSPTNLINDSLLLVLNEKERNVIHCLISNFQKKSLSIQDFYLSQSTIVYELSIPKTSLSRIFISLESKGLIRIKKFGKSKRIYLTDKIFRD